MGACLPRKKNSFRRRKKSLDKSALKNKVLCKIKKTEGKSWNIKSLVMR